jgi:hypothetical protein
VAERSGLVQNHAGHSSRRLHCNTIDAMRQQFQMKPKLDDVRGWQLNNPKLLAPPTAEGAVTLGRARSIGRPPEFP